VSEHLVTAVRTELSGDATHRHVSEVITPGPIRFTRHEVIDSIRAGNQWRTLARGLSTPIVILDRCPQPACSLAPYIAVAPQSEAWLKLEELDGW